jgi:hypothetical protein
MAFMRSKKNGALVIFGGRCKLLDDGWGLPRRPSKLAALVKAAAFFCVILFAPYDYAISKVGRLGCVSDLPRINDVGPAK